MRDTVGCQRREIKNTFLVRKKWKVWSGCDHAVGKAGMPEVRSEMICLNNKMACFEGQEAEERREGMRGEERGERRGEERRGER